MLTRVALLHHGMLEGFPNGRKFDWWKQLAIKIELLVPLWRINDGMPSCSLVSVPMSDLRQQCHLANSLRSDISACRKQEGIQSHWEWDLCKLQQIRANLPWAQSCNCYCKHLEYHSPSEKKAARTLTSFHGDFGKELPPRTLWRGSCWSCPLQALCCAPWLYRKKSTFWAAERRAKRCLAEGAKRKKGRVEVGQYRCVFGWFD